MLVDGYCWLTEDFSLKLVNRGVFLSAAVDVLSERAWHVAVRNNRAVSNNLGIPRSHVVVGSTSFTCVLRLPHSKDLASLAIIDRDAQSHILRESVIFRPYNKAISRIPTTVLLGVHVLVRTTIDLILTRNPDLAHHKSPPSSITKSS